MANYHVLAGIDSGNEYMVAFHIPLPAANNDAAVSYRDALVRSGIGGQTVMQEGSSPGQITTAELAQITSGALYEHAEQHYTNPGETLTAFRSRLDARYTTLADTSGVFLRDLRRRLRLFGYERTVP